MSFEIVTNIRGFEKLPRNLIERSPKLEYQFPKEYSIGVSFCFSLFDRGFFFLLNVFENLGLSEETSNILHATDCRLEKRNKCSSIWERNIECN